MDVYVKRTYDHHADTNRQLEVQYPFYDYRSRRQRAGPAVCPTQSQDNELSENGGMPQHLRPTQASTSMSNLDPSRVTLHIITETCQAVSLFDLYQEVINWVDPDLRLFRITERDDVFDASSYASLQSNTESCDVPAIAITIFLKATDQNANNKEEIEQDNRADEALQIFHRLPWQFHHSEQLTQGKINVVSSNSQDFYYTSHDLPLWAVRHVHYGREHVRYVLYTSENSWPEQVQLYQLILGLEPDVLRDDFCLFTMYTNDDYDIQFALKKLDSNVNIVTLDNVHIHVKVKDIGHLVPLFPNVCRPVSDVRWQTTDHDGNVIVLDSSQCFSSFNNNNELTYKNLNFEINAEHKCSSRERSVGKTKMCISHNGHYEGMSFQTSELKITQPANQTFLHTQHLDTSLHSSGFEDFEIELPSPPLRHVTTHEEDEESLCLTSTSEESGIQMHHGSEDSSFGEEECLRSCLSKNPALKIRHVKFKVRFREEVESFEDSFSRFSSGIESEGQSDGEVETSFRYNPSYTVNSPICTEEFSHKDLHDSTASDIGRNFMSSKTSLTESQNLSCSMSVVDCRLQQDTVKLLSPPKCHFSNTGDFNDLDIVSCCPTNRLINNELTTSSLKNVSATNFHQQNHNKQQRLSSSLWKTTEARDGNDIKHEISVRKMATDSASDICQSWQCSNTHSFTSIQTPLSSNKTRIKSNSFRHQTNNQQINSQLPCDIIPPKSERHRQHKNRSASVNSRQKKESQLPTPPATDSQKQRISVEPDPLDNKTLPDKRTESNPFPQLQHIQNGQKRFWFDESNKNREQADGADFKDTTLKFTLKFDTCPTSGLSCKQEQIGFYV